MAELQRRVEKLEAMLAKTGETDGAESPVPAKVMTTIRAKASGMFPNDFTLQSFYIQQQVESWRQLHGK